jgi:hypothetical protein
LRTASSPAPVPLLGYWVTTAQQPRVGNYRLTSAGTPPPPRASQHSDTSVSTKQLTKSFGWDTYDTFMQHDVQELNRVLVEKLEEKMKGTSVEGTMEHLFRGKFTNYVTCINVDDKSLRDEEYYDLQMPVKGCKDLYSSFDEYVREETLDGDNQYHSDRYGKQDAKKVNMHRVSLSHCGSQSDVLSRTCMVMTKMHGLPAFTRAILPMNTSVCPYNLRESYSRACPQSSSCISVGLSTIFSPTRWQKSTSGSNFRHI